LIRCLLVDDDLDIRQAMQAYLERYGMVVRTAQDGTGMRRALAEERFDLLLLDVRLPVIMLTAQGDPVSRVLGLELGADDMTMAGVSRRSGCTWRWTPSCSSMPTLADTTASTAGPISSTRARALA
jgi:CheY-like chemotaxis protein